jgi:ice-binding like protein
MSTLPRLTGRLAVVATCGALLAAAYQANVRSGPAPLAHATANPTPPGTRPLSAASSFALLGGPAVTCAGSAVTGDVGIAGTTAFTNSGCTITGSIHAGDAVATLAYNDLITAYAALVANPCVGRPLTGTLSGVTLRPGVHCFETAATLTGQATLAGPASGIWIFKIGTSGTGALTGTGFSGVLAGGGQPCNVFWLVAEGATLTDSHFVGTILAGAAIHLTRGSFFGQALAKAAVTVTGTTVTGCVRA